MSKPDEPALPDGRRLRSERSRQAIIDASIAFMDEGVLVPTAQQIAERAGVGIRSFFRHFADMGALFQAIDDQIRDSYETLFRGGNRDGTLRERIENLVELRTQAYETIRNTVLSTHAQLWRYEYLRESYARSQRFMRRDLDAWLPELKSSPDTRREAVNAVASFEMWYRLRGHQGLSRPATVEALTDLLKQLICES